MKSKLRSEKMSSSKLSIKISLKLEVLNLLLKALRKV